jgi:integrase
MMNNEAHQKVTTAHLSRLAYLYVRQSTLRQVFENTKHQTTFKTAWEAALRRAGIPYFRIYDLRSTFATRLSAGGVADEWVTQLLRQGDAQVFKKYSQMKLQMKREALLKLNRQANEQAQNTGTGRAN